MNHWYVDVFYKKALTFVHSFIHTFMNEHQKLKLRGDAFGCVQGEEIYTFFAVSWYKKLSMEGVSSTRGKIFTKFSDIKRKEFSLLFVLGKMCSFFLSYKHHEKKKDQK